MWKRLTLCVLLSALLAPYAQAQVLKSPRAPSIPTNIVLSTVGLYGGAIEAILEVTEVDALLPGFVNGQISSGSADLHVDVQLRAAEDNVLGARTAGEFIPFQTVHVKIQNHSRPGSKILEFDLAPHVGRNAGWHYASNVLLPPITTSGNPFDDAYLLTVTLASDNILHVHSDAVPPSTLFRGEGDLVIFNETAQLGPRTTGEENPPGVVPTLPAGNVNKQQALVAQFTTMITALPDFVTAGTIYIADTGFGETLQSAFQNYEDPSRYNENRALTTAALKSAEDNVANALAQQPVGNDCNAKGLTFDVECGEWVEKGGQRMFYLNLLHEIDEILPKIGEGNINAVNGAAHNWDEAWAFWQAIRPTAKSREGNCTEPEFGDPTNIDCDLVNSVDSALLLGSNVILNGGTGIEAQIAIIEERLSQLFYLATYHEIVSMREKDAGDAEGFGKARAEGAAFFSVIAYLVPGFDASALQARKQKRFTQAVAQNFMLRLRAQFTNIVSADRLGDPTTIP